MDTQRSNRITEKTGNRDLLETGIQYLKGVGPKRAELLGKELNIYTFRDLLYFFPYKYIDRSKFHTVKEIDTNLAYIQLKGRITGFRTEGSKYKQRLIARFTDDTGTMELVWFQGIHWVTRNIEAGKDYIIFGRPAIYNNRISIAHPEIDPVEKTDLVFSGKLQPQYSSTEKLKNSFITSKTIQKLVAGLFQHIGKMDETLPQHLIHRLHFPDINEALYSLHFPAGHPQLKKATYRLKFEELFYIQLNILRQKNRNQQTIKGHVFASVGNYVNDFYHKKLTFELTEAQKRVIREIRKDLGSGKQMNRLLQGDVGSGKTLVAVMAILIALDNGYQACLMAPTEILANQHFATISHFLEGLSVNVKLLTGSTRKAERNTLFAELAAGDLQVLIGTHALLEDPVQFNNLGLVVIDEQQRFGVAQRARLRQKNTDPPHVLVMTATPIPRTLAMTLYGDLDVSEIDEMPPGRKPIMTIHYSDSKRLVMFGFLREQIKQGRQVYMVYPLISESEKLDYKALDDGYEAMVRAFPPPRYLVVCAHGRLKTEEKDLAMQLFQTGKAHIMVATTVIEVGVDIPNATVMVIESAERFGLSQLHQLRGRVGRGADQSYCILMTSHKQTAEARKRIETMINTTDGFVIAEADLKLRGPGDIEGTQQSGIPFDLKIASLSEDGLILQFARDTAQELLSHDPDLSAPENGMLVKQLKRLSRSQVDWSSIS
ncbi:MAG: ATP-dependent DNA helicase RecG [Bacteroidales bacterium]|nr:ATP-dependent DNA helicase RecG [Bacteroidales bacterium]